MGEAANPQDQALFNLPRSQLFRDQSIDLVQVPEGTATDPDGPRQVSGSNLPPYRGNMTIQAGGDGIRISEFMLRRSVFHCLVSQLISLR